MKRKHKIFLAIIAGVILLGVILHTQVAPGFWAQYGLPAALYSGENKTAYEWMSESITEVSESIPPRTHADETDRVTAYDGSSLKSYLPGCGDFVSVDLLESIDDPSDNVYHIYYVRTDGQLVDVQYCKDGREIKHVTLFGNFIVRNNLFVFG